MQFWRLDGLDTHGRAGKPKTAGSHLSRVRRFKLTRMLRFFWGAVLCESLLGQFWFPFLCYSGWPQLNRLTLVSDSAVSFRRHTDLPRFTPLPLRGAASIQASVAIFC